MRRELRILIGLAIVLGSLLLTYYIPSILARHKDFEFIHVIEVEALLLSIFALGFALKQFHDSAEVSKQLSTRFLSFFPNNLDDLTQLVSDSSDTLDIMVDYAGYGMYSDPARFAAYCAALEHHAVKAKIRILLYANDLAKLAIQEQWSEGAVRDEVRHKTRLKHFLDEHQELIGRSSSEEVIQRMSYDDFIELSLRGQIQIQHRFANKKNIEMRFIDSPELVILAWIRADHHAIFTFKSQGIKFRELSFKTRDKALVDVFRDLFDQLWNENQPASKTSGQKEILDVKSSAAVAS